MYFPAEENIHNELQKSFHGGEGPVRIFPDFRAAQSMNTGVKFSPNEDPSYFSEHDFMDVLNILIDD